MHWQNRAHFFAISAQLMRHILVDHARAHTRAKRGGGAHLITFDEGTVVSRERAADVIALDDALNGLATLDLKQSRIVESYTSADSPLKKRPEPPGASTRHYQTRVADSQSLALPQTQQRVNVVTPERWQQVKGVLDAALEREPQERAVFISKACEGDEPLRKELESLIISHEQAGNFIEEPAVAALAEIITVKGESIVNHTLGAYQVQVILGAGGMGEVYLAEDRRLGRRIALKLLPAHLSADQDRLRRFQQEARAASSLNHPNILTIYEVGEAKGRPFIATEFIEGETLRKRMTEARLELATR